MALKKAGSLALSTHTASTSTSEGDEPHLRAGVMSSPALISNQQAGGLTPPPTRTHSSSDNGSGRGKPLAIPMRLRGGMAGSGLGPRRYGSLGNIGELHNQMTEYDEDYAMSEGGYEESEGGYGNFSLNQQRPSSLQQGRSIRGRGMRGRPMRGGPIPRGAAIPRGGRVRMPVRGRGLPKSQSMDFVVGAHASLATSRMNPANRMTMAGGELSRFQHNSPPIVPEEDEVRYDADGYIIPPPPPANGDDDPPPPPPDDDFESDENKFIPPPPPDDGLEFDENGYLISNDTNETEDDETGTADSSSIPYSEGEDLQSEDGDISDIIHSPFDDNSPSFFPLEMLSRPPPNRHQSAPHPAPRSGSPGLAQRGQPRGRPRGRAMPRGGPSPRGTRGTLVPRGRAAPRGVPIPRGAPVPRGQLPLRGRASPTSVARFAARQAAARPASLPSSFQPGQRSGPQDDA